MEQDFARLIYAAVETKYGEYSIAEVRAVVAEAIDDFLETASERALLWQSEPTCDLSTDVVNQTRCLYAIEMYWRHRPAGRRFLEKLHAVSYGLRLCDVKPRTNEFVPDYGGTVPWESNNISNGLRLISRELRHVGALRDASTTKKGQFLASLFSAVIRVHPFEDGNGRTARMLVQYCVRFWGDDFIVVPKVRNSQRWKRCLEDGVHGNLKRMEKYFADRIRPRTMEAEEPREP